MLLPRLVSALALTIVLAACRGPTGPMGPEGPAGPAGAQGPPGTTNKLSMTGTVANDGSAIRALPAEAGTLTNLPALICFIRPPGAPGWLLVADAYSDTTPYCGLGSISGVFSAVMFDAPPSWEYTFLVFW